MRVADCLTPPGRSAIATISVTGFESVHEFDPYFKSVAGMSISDFPIGRIIFGNWTNLHGSSEELVVVRVSESEIQIHCHGGALPIQVILESLEQIGFASSKVSKKTYLDAKSLDEELEFGLVNAPTKRVANIILNLSTGTIQKKVKEWIAKIESDDCDEGEVIEQIQDLQDTFSTGKFLVRPAQVVLAGLPNVGKSSINNQILGYARSIILDQPGTTRDVVSEETTIDGWPFEFSDTAGLRNTEEAIEAEGIKFARQRILNADLIALVYTAEFGIQNILKQKEQLGEMLDGYNGPTISVINKLDLVPKEDIDLDNIVDSPLALTNANTGDGIEALMQLIKQSVISKEPKGDDAIIFTSRQFDILQETILALESKNRIDAIEKLLTI